MKKQGAREEQTVTIATALVRFLGALGIGMLVLLLVGWATDTSQTFETGFWWAVVAAGVVGGTFLVRHRR